MKFADIDAPARYNTLVFNIQRLQSINPAALAGNDLSP